MSLYKNKYRVESTRLPGWDYSSNGMYFITMVTQHRICNLGEIVAENIPVMKLSDFGKIVDAEWQKSFEIRNESFHRLPKSISSFLAGFKSAANSKIDDYIDQNDLNIPKYNRNNHFFQSNYHDHIIRNEKELFRIRQYINNNAQNWMFDSLNSQGGLSNEQ